MGRDRERRRELRAQLHRVDGRRRRRAAARGRPATRRGASSTGCRCGWRSPGSTTTSRARRCSTKIVEHVQGAPRARRRGREPTNRRTDTSRGRARGGLQPPEDARPGPSGRDHRSTSRARAPRTAPRPSADDRRGQTVRSRLRHPRRRHLSRSPTRRACTPADRRQHRHQRRRRHDPLVAQRRARQGDLDDVADRLERRAAAAALSRLPEPRQARFMAYDAIVAGARGLFFFGGHITKAMNAPDGGAAGTGALEHASNDRCSRNSATAAHRRAHRARSRRTRSPRERPRRHVHRTRRRRLLLPDRRQAKPDQKRARPLHRPSGRHQVTARVLAHPTATSSDHSASPRGSFTDPRRSRPTTHASTASGSGLRSPLGRACRLSLAGQAVRPAAPGTRILLRPADRRWRPNLPLRHRRRGARRHTRLRGRAGKVSYGSPGDVAANGGIVVVEADGRNFGYWHVTPSVQPGATCRSTACSDTSQRSPKTGATCTSPSPRTAPTGSPTGTRCARAPSSPFFDYGPPVIDAIIASLPPTGLHGLVDFSVKSPRQHTRRRHPAEPTWLARTCPSHRHVSAGA